MQITNIIENVMSKTTLPVLLIVLFLLVCVAIKDRKSKASNKYIYIYMAINFLFLVLYIVLEKTGRIKSEMGFSINIYANISFLIAIIMIVLSTLEIYKSTFKLMNETELESKIDEIMSESKDIEKIYIDIIKLKKELSYLRHDMANHIQIIKSVNRDIGDEKYDEITKKIHMLDETKRIDNPMVSIILDSIIKKLAQRNVKVNAEIDMRMLNNISCDKLLVVLTLICDMVGKNACEKDEVSMKIRTRKDNNSKIKILFNISSNASCDRSNEKIIKYFIDEMQGDVLFTINNDKTVATGMMEVDEIC